MKELEGKTAIVTGAGSPRGIGRAVVEVLAREGANIVATDVGKSDPDPIMQALGYDYGAAQGLNDSVAAAEAAGVSALGVEADITKEDEVAALVKQTREQFGGVDILVNVAGGSWGSNRTGDYEPEDWLKTIRVNLYGTFLVTRACLGVMEYNGGSIVSISSIAAERAHEMTSAYGAAKAGIVQFMRDVAVEYGPNGVRANAILPGDIQTDLLDMEYKGMGAVLGVTPEEVGEMSAGSTPLRRLGKPSDVAELAAFLASDRAAWLTGLAIPVTGGKHLPFRGH